jgi:phosphatidylglycerophosphate synthase
MFLGEQAALPGSINSFIHVIMYFYYFLAALGPHMQPYLWWKKYLTRMQIVSINEIHLQAYF